MDFTVSILADKISSTEILKSLSIGILLVTVHVLFFFGLIKGLLVVASYILGLYILHFSIQYMSNVNDILSFLTHVVLQKCWPNLSENRDSEPKKSNEVHVPLEIDNALDQFMNRLVRHYLTHWYANISADLDFPYEIRITIQNAVSNCYRRLSQVKKDEFLFKKILPVCLNHIHSYNKLKTDTNISCLHIAVHSRTAELLYLQNVSKNIMKYLVQNSELRCEPFSILLREILTRNLFLALSDTVCNPDNLNPILLHYLKGHYNFLSAECCEAVEEVILLDKFVSAVKPQPLNSNLRPDLATILKEDDLKEAFMRYLRSKNADHMLQFCIDIEIFSDKLTRQNLNAEELDNLYRDAWDLYSVYFSSYSPNCIHFEDNHATTLRKALSKDILKLASTKILSDAYENVYAQLEHSCYDFYSSNEFYFWLYGRPESSELVRSHERLQLYDDVTPSESVSLERKTKFELGSIIKEVLKPDQILEGQVQEVSDSETSMELGEDVQMTVSTCERNMSNWKISIPALGTRVDPITNRPFTVFVVQTQAESGEDWVVERRPSDFYSLDVKLTEFHGSFREAQLPPRRLMSSRAECIQMHEEYLNKLVKIPALKNSELLSTFLSSVENLEEEETSLGKLFRKSVVPTLRKERGQNLEPFIKVFVSSCKMTKYEWRDVGEVKQAEKSDCENQIYENNFNVNPDVSQQIFYTQAPPAPNDAVFEKPSASLLYLGIRLYNVQHGIIRFLLALQSFFGGVVDQLITHYIRHSFSRILNIANIAYMINLTEKAVFENKHKKYNPEEINIGLIETLDSLKKQSWLHPFYVLLYETLQNAKLNKQLYYQLMDVVIEELFPELNEVDRG